MELWKAVLLVAVIWIPITVFIWRKKPDGYQSDELKVFVWEKKDWPAYEMILGVVIAYTEEQARELLAQEAFPIGTFDDFAEPPIPPKVYSLEPKAWTMVYFD